MSLQGDWAAEGADGAFGDAEEFGLRMIAALEAMPSLEPDCEEILVSEASVMIVETGDPASGGQNPGGGAINPLASLSVRLRNVDETAKADGSKRDVVQSHGEEVEVEIVLPDHEDAN